MRRRRRRREELAFSFDSFLDVVANVCGVVIRLILVAWVGARSYPSIHKLVPVASVQSSEIEELNINVPPELVEELERHREEIAIVEKALSEQAELLDRTRASRAPLDAKLTELLSLRDRLAQSERTLADSMTTSQGDAPSLEELRVRREKLLADLRELEKSPREHRVLKYQTPVSRPVQAEQFMFECREGRVAFINVAALEAAVRRELPEKGELLKSRWRHEGTTAPVGAFRMRYVLEREAGFSDTVSAAGAAPLNNGGYRYGLTGWTVEPMASDRGEDVTQALAAGSEFRRITDALDARQAVVTFWVYPDSFAAFRALRDHLYERELVVAGRPLPFGAPIAASRDGSVSRGQ